MPGSTRVPPYHTTRLVVTLGRAMLASEHRVDFEAPRLSAQLCGLSPCIFPTLWPVAPLDPVNGVDKSRVLSQRRDFCYSQAYFGRSYWISGSYAPALSEKHNAFSRPLKKKCFKEESMTKFEVDAIGMSTTLESNKSLRRLIRAVSSPDHDATDWHLTTYLATQT